MFCAHCVSLCGGELSKTMIFEPLFYLSSEKLFMMIADHFVKDGYQAVGWEFVVMGDCWLDRTRDSQGRLQPDPKRFPSGIAQLANFVSTLHLLNI